MKQMISTNSIFLVVGYLDAALTLGAMSPKKEGFIASLLRVSFGTDPVPDSVCILKIWCS
jgi:hypothetical protein